MKKNLLLMLVVIGLSANSAFATTYYVSTSGDDTYSGISMTTPWKTLSKVSTTNFSPGDSILFKAGEIFVGQLVISSSGTSGNPIVYGKYGSGALPYLAAQGGHTNTIYSYNKEYFELTNLKVTNYLPGNDVNNLTGTLLRAVYIENYRAGTLGHIYLTGMEINGVNSRLVPFEGGAPDGTRYFGGVHFEVKDDLSGTGPVPSKFNDVLISDCNFHDLGRTALGSTSYWGTRSAISTFGQIISGTTKDNWVPSTGVVISHNVFTNIDGNGIIWRTSAGTLIEYNLFDTCGAVLSGNAAFCSGTDGTVFQFNEAKNTVYNTNGITEFDANGNKIIKADTDARGIDVDMKCKNTIVQYNYLHDNQKGGFVATGGFGESTNPNATMFTLGTIVRYNILEDNEQMGIVVSGNCYDMTVHNNVIFSNSTINNNYIVDIHTWTQGGKVGTPHDINFYNNIFWAKGTGAEFYHVPAVYDITYGNNLYHWNTTTPPANLPVVGYSSNTNVIEDSFAVIGSPLLKAAGDNHDDGYTLEVGSPAFNAAKRGFIQPTLDYYQNTIGNTRNIGVDQTPGVSEYKIDINHTDNGSISAGWTGLVGTNGSQTTINGVHFTVFNSLGTSDRGTAGNVTRDFAHASGTNASIGFRMENLPAGTYDVSTWQYDPSYPGLVNIEYQEKGLPATMVVKASGKSLASSAATTFQITVEEVKDYEILVREASSEHRSRFNGITITPVSATEGLTAKKAARTDMENQTVPVDDALMIFPNPVASRFTISKNVKQDDNLKVIITDMQGRIIYNKDYSVLAGNWQLELNKDDLKLARGVYHLRVQSATGKTQTAGILAM